MQYAGGRDKKGVAIYAMCDTSEEPEAQNEHKDGSRGRIDCSTKLRTE
jgi:hypothetical protein